MSCADVKRLSDGGEFAEGDYVTRHGSDVHLVKEITGWGDTAVFVCVVPGEDGLYEVGDEEDNLCHRYTRVNYKPPEN